jgi:hypothetical protein
MRFIEIRLTKYRIYLTETEINKLLSKDPLLWQEAIKRGKAIKRVETASKRKSERSKRHGK